MIFVISVDEYAAKVELDRLDFVRIDVESAEDQ